jgi:hypothetical protein
MLFRTLIRACVHNINHNDKERRRNLTKKSRCPGGIRTHDLPFSWQLLYCRENGKSWVRIPSVQRDFFVRFLLLSLSMFYSTAAHKTRCVKLWQLQEEISVRIRLALEKAAFGSTIPSRSTVLIWTDRMSEFKFSLSLSPSPPFFIHSLTHKIIRFLFSKCSESSPSFYELDWMECFGIP